MARTALGPKLDAVRRHVLEHAVKRGDFVLKSGARSSWFLDTKQTDYAPVVTGPRTQPRFADLWAPMDGFVVNGGVKLTL